MMEQKFLPTFAGWLGALGEDVLSLANLLSSPEAPEPFRLVSAQALESLLRAAELIPEGLENLGYLEQAFIFRLLARRAVSESPELGSEGRVPRLAAEAEWVDAFIADDLAALSELAFVEARRGRPAGQLLEDEEARAEVLREARAWVEGYRAPELGDGAEELVKLRAFFRTRLRRAS